MFFAGLLVGAVGPSYGHVARGYRDDGLIVCANIIKNRARRKSTTTLIDKNE